MIHINDACLRYGSHIIFEKLSLSLQPNEWTAIIGPSGVGKSSLLKLLAGVLVNDNAKQVLISLHSNIDLKKNSIYLPQDNSLLPWLTVYDNLLIGAKLQKSFSNTLSRDVASHVLSIVSLSHAKDLYPHQLSGGMRQRLLLARLLLQDKPIILMDEPFKSLDAMMRFHLQSLFAKQLQTKTVVFVTHDLQEAARLAHNIYFMHGNPATLSLSATLKDSIPRDLTAEQVLKTQEMLYPLWSKA